MQSDKNINIWGAIDKLAKRQGLTPSALARKSGLDPTAFNPSKRSSASGKPRWPSTESIAKMLEATNTPAIDFLMMTTDGDLPPSALGIRPIPVLGFAQAGDPAHFDEAGAPAGPSWNSVPMPGFEAANGPVYGLEVSGDSMMPVYRDGDLIIIKPGEPKRRGDRVVVRTVDNEVMVKQLGWESEEHISLESLNPEVETMKLDRTRIKDVARIIWVSQ